MVSSLVMSMWSRLLQMMEHKAWVKKSLSPRTLNLRNSAQRLMISSSHSTSVPKNWWPIPKSMVNMMLTGPLKILSLPLMSHRNSKIFLMRNFRLIAFHCQKWTRLLQRSFHQLLRQLWANSLRVLKLKSNLWKLVFLKRLARAKIWRSLRPFLKIIKLVLDSISNKNMKRTG